MEYPEITTAIEEATTKEELKVALVALFDKKLKSATIASAEDEGAIARLRARIMIEL